VPNEVIPEDLLNFRPTEKIKIDSNRLLDALRSAGRGSAQDLAGMRYEHLRVLIEDDEAWSIFAQLAEAFARAEVPEVIMQGLRLGRLTALKKDNGRVRGIVAGAILRRLVCKTVAKQHAENFLKATSPFQFALQTKAGIEALAHMLRVLAESDEEIVVLSLDGIGAFDHVTRATFMKKLHSIPELQELLPLTTALYGSDSRFIWTDDEGIAHIIIQAEGGEQGCPFMPALFSLAQHDV